MSTPTVAIVGRPNVGKSTLFNRLVGRRQAIVHDQPGVTRDRVFGVAALDERSIQLVDTGGLVPGDDPLGLGAQVLLAVEESDALLFLVDGVEGLTAADQRVWEALRRYGKPTVLVVNKGDVRKAREGFGEFYGLGIDPVLVVSAEHGGGIPDLRLALAAMLPPQTEAPPSLEGVPKIAVVGRPNVGKSSLVNRLSGQLRALVSPLAGTTRDPLDTLLEREDRRYLLIDTAGIRRRSQVSGAAEGLAVMLAGRQIERADVAILLIDATAGVTSGDLAIAGTIWERGRAAVVAINKWDLLDEDARERLDLSFPRLDEILSGPLRVNISALSGRAVEKLFPAVDAALRAFRLELGTGEVNRVFERAVAAHLPPTDQHRPWKFYYATQVSTGPPTFMLFANRTLPHAHSYRRYLENRLREAYELGGVPVRLVIRKR